MKKILFSLLLTPVLCKAQTPHWQMNRAYIHSSIEYQVVVTPDSFISISQNGDEYLIKINSAYPISIEHNGKKEYYKDIFAEMVWPHTYSNADTAVSIMDTNYVHLPLIVWQDSSYHPIRKQPKHKLKPKHHTK